MSRNDIVSDLIPDHLLEEYLADKLTTKPNYDSEEPDTTIEQHNPQESAAKARETINQKIKRSYRLGR